MTNNSETVSQRSSAEQPILHEDIVNRIKAKAEQQGIEDILTGMSRPETHFSSLELVLIAERLGVSVHWIITGERDPYEIRLVHCTGSYPFEDEE